MTFRKHATRILALLLAVLLGCGLFFGRRIHARGE